MKKFQGLVVDDQFWNTIVKIFLSNGFIDGVSLAADLLAADLKCDGFNAMAYEGIKIFASNNKETAKALIKDKSNSFEFFIFDADLSEQYPNEPDAIGYGFNLWKTVMDEYGSKNPLVVVYTRSPQVIKIIRALLDDERANPRILGFGSEKQGLEQDQDELDGAAGGKLVSLISKHLHQRAKAIVQYESGHFSKENVNHQITSCIESGTQDFKNRFDVLKTMQIGDDRDIQTLFPRETIEIERELRAHTPDVELIKGNLFRIKSGIFSTFGDLLYGLVKSLTQENFPNVHVAQEMERLTGFKKVDHFLESYNDGWNIILDQICDFCVERFGDIIFTSRSAADDFWGSLKHSKASKDPAALKQVVTYLKSIRDEWLNEHHICLSSKDHERITNVINLNGKRHTTEKTGIMTREIGGDDRYVVLSFKVSNQRIEPNDFSRIKESLERKYEPEHLSELREIVCQQYSGIIEIGSSSGGISIGPVTFNVVAASVKEVKFEVRDDIEGGTHYILKFPKISY